MRLETLRPKQGADLHQLQNLLDTRDWRALLPDALPEDVLLSLAHDFRLVEISQAEDAQDTEEHVLAMASAILVVMGLLMRNPARQDSLDEFTVSEEGLARAMQCYQHGV